MLTNEPGWYPDPDGARQVRFWDGEGWTEYVQPFAPVLTRQRGAGTATEDYPYLLDADLRRPNEPRLVSSWAPAAVVGAPAGGGRRSSAHWWVIGGVAALVVAVLAVLLALRPDSPPLADPAPSSTVSPGTPVTLGAPVVVDVPTAGVGVVSLEVPQDGAYFVEATAATDITAELLRDGDVVWSGDDRRRELAEIVGGQWHDPGVFLDLTAGTYTMEVADRSGLAVSATVALYEADVVDVAVGDTVTVDLPAGGYVVARVTLDGETRLTVDVRDPEGDADARLTTFTSGAAVTTDDRGPDVAADTGASEYDPYLVATFPEGASFLVIDEYSSHATTLEVAITAG